MTSMSTWPFTTSWKCSTQCFNLCRHSARFCHPWQANWMRQAWNFFPKNCRSLIRDPPLPCCSATKSEGAVRLSLGCTFTPPSIACLLSCNFGELLTVVLSFKMSDVLWQCIFQTNPSLFLFPGRVGCGLYW